MKERCLCSALVATMMVGCGEAGDSDGGVDASRVDGAVTDGGTLDGGPGSIDAGPPPVLDVDCTGARI